MNQDFVELGSKLKREREGRALGLRDVSRVTKIPERSLTRLEEGKWEELPGEVFIRGFLRSYARCVGLDGEELVRQYGQLAVKPRSPASGSSPPLADPVDQDRQDVTEATDPTEPPAAEQKADSPTLEMNLLARAIADAGRGTRRVSLTVAVIVLVIVATLTLSLLLRRPDHHGDGLSSVDGSTISPSALAWRPASPHSA
jgi:cytoskeleton protein RodZ